MAKTIDPALAEKLRDESEQTKDEDYPAGTTGRRPNRQKVYSVRLSAEEEAEVQRVAAAKHLPASTLVRSWILERLDSERSPSGMAMTNRSAMNDASRIGRMLGCSSLCASRASRLKSARKCSLMELSCGIFSATCKP